MGHPPHNFRPASSNLARAALGFWLPSRVVGAQWPSDAELLGAAHPLVRVSRRVATVERQALATAAVLAALVGVGDEAFASAVTVSAAGVLLVLLVIVAVLMDERRRQALDLIVEGQEWLPVRPVVRERDRLASTRAQVRLAKSFECVFEEGLGLRRLAPASLPMVRPSVAAAVPAELAVVTALLRSGRPGLRGVALVERLLTDGESPLYGEDAAALRAELRHAHSLLCS
jgi:hypothetical protein